MKIFRMVFFTLVLAVFGFVLYLAMSRVSPPPVNITKEVIKQAGEDTGAPNLVTSIYLGYRSFDTLGETVVLLVSVSGITYLLGKKHDAPD